MSSICQLSVIKYPIYPCLADFCILKYPNEIQARPLVASASYWYLLAVCLDTKCQQNVPLHTWAANVNKVYVHAST